MEECVKKKRVCVIGSGAAGLVAIRHILSASNLLEGIVFEQSNQLGGLWVYSDLKSEKPNSLYNSTPMYRDMQTNIPKEVMGFLNFPFSNTNNCCRSFVSHTMVLQYLQDYASHFHLMDHIQFNKRVISVAPIMEDSNPKWNVIVQSTQSLIKEEYIFDSVMICNGHFNKPIIPDIANISDFEGQILHSRDYLIPEAFAGKRVVIVGAGPSGIDICLEIAQVATEVILSMKTAQPYSSSSFPSNVKQVLPIKSSTKSGFIFEDGSEAHNVDAIIYCTGYEYDFPFLEDKFGLKVKNGGKTVTPLYRHMIHPLHPSICFIGIPNRVCPFILFDCQARYYVKYLTGMISLPTTEEMNKERREDNSLRKIYYHKLDSAQWQYFQVLADEADFELRGPTSPPVDMEVIKNIYEETFMRRCNANLYKNGVVHIIDEKRYEYCPGF